MPANGVWLYNLTNDQVELWQSTDALAGIGKVDISSASGLLIAKAGIFNIALPAINTDWLALAIVPTISPSHLEIYVCVAVGGVFSVARTNGGVTVVEDANQGVALTANAGYCFKLPWLVGDDINFRYSATGANILRLIANEEIL